MSWCGYYVGCSDSCDGCCVACEVARHALTMPHMPVTWPNASSGAGTKGSVEGRDQRN
jgi:hypothetical protein